MLSKYLTESRIQSRGRSLLPQLVRSHLKDMKTSSFHEWRGSRREHRQPISLATEKLSSNHVTWGRSKQKIERKQQKALRAFLCPIPRLPKPFPSKFFPSWYSHIHFLGEKKSYFLWPKLWQFSLCSFSTFKSSKNSKLTYPC